jgi:hypothetical protein
MRAGFSGIAPRWKLRNSRRPDAPSRAGVADPRAARQAEPAAAPTSVDPPAVAGDSRRLTRASARWIAIKAAVDCVLEAKGGHRVARFTTEWRGDPDFRRQQQLLITITTQEALGHLRSLLKPADTTPFMRQPHESATACRVWAETS